MTEIINKNVLITFLKYPEAGKVKTRLAKEVGPERAADIYSQMAKEIIESVSVSKRYKTIIFYDPPDKENDIRNWVGKRELIYKAQQGNILGEKISNAFKEVFSLGADKVVIIGTDCTELTSETINEAMRLLNNFDVVLGPAEDGGYYLLGQNKYIPEIFQGISWSTERVLEQTISKIKENNLKYDLLAVLRDIDTVDDLNSSSENLTNTG